MMPKNTHEYIMMKSQVSSRVDTPENVTGKTDSKWPPKDNPTIEQHASEGEKHMAYKDTTMS